MSIKETLGSTQWLKNNENKLKEFLPETWTHMENIEALKIAYRLKLIGIDFRSTEEFGWIMLFLEKIGILLRDGYTVRRNPNSIFK